MHALYFRGNKKYLCEKLLRGLHSGQGLKDDLKITAVGAGSLETYLTIRVASPLDKHWGLTEALYFLYKTY